MGQRFFSTGIAFILLLCAAIWLCWSYMGGKPTIVYKNVSQFPDAYMENVNALQMDDKGLPESRLQSPIILHYEKNSTSDITKPLIYIYPHDQPFWQITAENGQSVNGAGIIYLWNNVLAHQKADKNSPETTLNTSQATVFPKQKIALTNQLVTLTRPDLQVQSIGARANMKSGEITLFSKVQGFYESNTNSTHPQ